MIQGIDSRFTDQAQYELGARIAHTGTMREQYKKSYSGYSSIRSQIVLLVLNIAVIIALAAAYTYSSAVLNWLMLRFDAVSSVMEISDPQMVALLIAAVLVPACIYFLLRIIRIVMRLLRIGKVDSYVSGVQQIENYMQSFTSNMHGAALDAQKLVLSDDNVRIEPRLDIDPSIEKYNAILKAYTNPNDDNLLNKATTVLHWYTFVAFGCSFLVLSGWLNFKEYSISSFVLIPIFLAVILGLQELMSKNNVRSINDDIKKTAGVVSALSILSLIVYLNFFYDNKSFIMHPLEGNNYADLKVIGMTYIPIFIGILLVSFVSFICNINRTLTGFILFASILGIVINSILINHRLHGMQISAVVLQILVNTIAIPVIMLTVFGFIWNRLKISKESFSFGHGLLGMLCASIDGLVVCILIGIICGLAGVSFDTLLMLFTTILAIFAICGFIWNGFEELREIFSVPFSTWGILAGIPFGLSLAFSSIVCVPDAFDEGCLFGLLYLIFTLTWRLLFLPFAILAGMGYGFFTCARESDFEL